jgi:hypothetical protein
MENTNIKYTKDDSNLNDFLYCTNEFGERPSKIVMTFNFKSLEFSKYFAEIECINVVTEASPADGVNMINEKYFAKINKNIYISYTHLDKNVDKSVITNVIIYYNTPHLGTLLEDIDSFIEKDSELIGKDKINIINYNHATHGYTLEGMDIIEADYDNLNLYYNKSSAKGFNKIIKKIKKKNKGLFIMHGKRGAGKTTALSFIANNCSKMSIFIPNNMIEYTINNPDFLEVLKTYSPLLILDDCEVLLDGIYSKSDIIFTNLLQLVDGFHSNELDTHILMCFNINSEDELDSTLIEANNLLKIVEVKPLNVETSNALSKHLGFNYEIKEDILLVNLLKENIEEEYTSKIGFE